MAEVILAKTAGFCFGVQRAVETVYKELENASALPIHTLGPIVHNEEVVKDLRERGVDIIETPEEIRAAEGTVIIRAHGVPEDVLSELKERGVRIVDATCPFVQKIHRVAKEQKEAGNRLIIVGDPTHPEVIGIRSRAGENAEIIQNLTDFLELCDEKSILPDEKLSFVAQTTYNHQKFQEIIDSIRNLGYHVFCFNTICNATRERQEEAAVIASEVDAMIVAGSSGSSNTRKLYEICRERCAVTRLVTGAGEISKDDFIGAERIGITAGASTPKHIIEEVHLYVRTQL